MRRIFLLACLSCGAMSVTAAEPKLELVVQTGHSSGTKSVSLTSDGSLALTGSWDGTAILWDARTGEMLRTFKGYTGKVTCVTLSADGSRALTAADYGAAILWDTKTGNQLRTFERKGGQNEVASLSADGSRVQIGTIWGVLPAATLWDAKTGEQIRTTFHARCTGMSLNKDGSLALFCDEGSQYANLMDVSTDSKNLHWFKMPDKVTSVSLSANGSRALTGSKDKSAILWDTKTGKELFALKGHTGPITGVSLSQDGGLALTGSEDKTAIVWDAKKGEKLFTLDGDNQQVTSVSLSADGSRALTGFYDRGAAIWDAKTGKQLVALAGHTRRVSSVSLSRNGRVLTCGGSGETDKTAILWDVGAGKPPRILKGHTDRIYTASLSGEGNLALTGSWDATAKLWDPSTGGKLLTLKGPTGVGESVNLSADGKRALTDSWDKTAILWDTKSGEKLFTFKGHTGFVRATSLSSDGSRALTGGYDDKTVILWDATTGKSLHTLKLIGTVYGACLSGDGRVAMTYAWDTQFSKKELIVWEVRTGKPISSHAFDLSSGDLRLNHDGSRALTIHRDGKASLWDVKNGQTLFTLEGHVGAVTGVGLSPDGNRALTGSLDGVVRLWDTTNGKELCALISLDGGNDWLAVTPDGYFDGSENAAKFIRYRNSGTREVVPLERYRKQFERPGLLAMVWKGEDYRGKDAVKQELPPTVRITSPANGHTSKDGKFTITAEAESRGKLPVTSFRLKVNNKPHVKNQGMFEVESPKAKATATWDIQLEPGRHTIEVLAYTKAVFNVSEAIEVKYVGGEKLLDKEPPGTLYVLSVGISAYPDKDDKLDFAHKDAQEISKAYQRHGEALFKKIEAKTLTDDKATREAVLDGLEWLRKSATQKDYAVFFFAGHGVKDEEGELFLLPVDGKRDKLTRTAIDASVLQKELVKIPGQLLVLLDACHAGKVLDKSRSGRGLTESLLKDLSSEEKGVTIMCSATGRQEAKESRQHGHGMFTVALLEALSGKGNELKGDDELKVRLRDGAVYFKQLDSYVTDRVKQLSNGTQHPVTGSPRNSRDFPVSKPDVTKRKK